ncbi:hypothetical protein ACET3Z_030484 [Daucus carota]
MKTSLHTRNNPFVFVRLFLICTLVLHILLKILVNLNRAMSFPQESHQRMLEEMRLQYALWQFRGTRNLQTAGCCQHRPCWDSLHGLLGRFCEAKANVRG